MALGSSVYKLVFDTQGLDTLTATRKELNAARKIMDESRTDMQKYAEEWDFINNLLNKNLLTVGAYNQKLAELKDKYLPENIALKKQQAEAEEQATKAAKEALKEQQAITARAKQLDEQYMPVRKQAARDLAELRSHYQAGRVSVDSYRQGVLQLTAAQLTGVPIIGNLAAMLADANPLILAAGAAFAGGVGAMRLFSSAVDTVTANVSDQIGKIDDLINTSQNIGLAAAEFQNISVAANLADIEIEKTAGGVEKMLTAISKGAEGSAKMVRVFEMLGLDAGKLRDMRADEAFAEITKALDKMPNAADRARAATAIFGSPDFLRVDVSHLENASQLIRDIGGELGAADAAAFSEMDDAVKRLEVTLDTVWKQVAIELSPALGEVAELANDVLVRVATNETLTKTLSDAVDATEGLLAVAREVPGVIDGWGVSVGNFLDAFALNNPRVGLLMKLADMAASPLGELGAAQQQSRELDASLQETVGGQTGQGTATTRGGVATDTLDAHDELLEKLRQEVDYYGLTREEIELLKLAEQGASQAIRDQAHALASQAIELRRLDEAAQEAARAEEERAKTVARASAELMDEAEREAIAEMKKAEAARESLDVLDEELEKREEILSLQNASTAMIKVGSREAFDLLARTQQNVASRAPAPFIVKPAEESLALAREANALLAAIAGKDSTVAVEEITA